MKNRANPTAIGAFVIGALALAIGAVLLLGVGNLFKSNVEMVAFFPGSVNGLSVGAPVKFKGVEIGRVQKILISVDEAYRTDFHIPVFFELDPEKMTRQGAPVTPESLRDKKLLRSLYDSGLRAQLEAESLVTGVLYVELDIHPNTPYKLQLSEDSKLREIPTLPTTLEQATGAIKEIFDKLEEVDFGGLVMSVNETVKEINTLVSSPELNSVAKNLNTLLGDADSAVSDISGLVRSARGKVDDVAESVEKTMQGSRATLSKIDGTLTEAQKTLSSVSGLIQPESGLLYQLDETLSSLREAARSVRQLADSLDRNPSALVFGREPGDDEE